MASFESLLSNIKRFTWSFDDDNGHYAAVSCLGLSVDEARQILLSYLEKFESLRDEHILIQNKRAEWYKKKFKETSNLSYSDVVKKAVQDDLSEKMIDQLRKDFDNKYPKIDAHIFGGGRAPIEYSRSMKVKVDGKTKKITLGNLILHTEPEVSDVNLVSFESSDPFY
jgi:hypothetical protein